jgi:hypothetical protein
MAYYQDKAPVMAPPVQGTPAGKRNGFRCFSFPFPFFFARDFVLVSIVSFAFCDFGALWLKSGKRSFRSEREK